MAKRKSEQSIIQTIEEMINSYIRTNGCAPSEIRVNPKVHSILAREWEIAFLKLDDPTPKNRDRADNLFDLIERKVKLEALEKMRSERAVWGGKGKSYFVYEGDKIPFVEDKQVSFVQLC